MDPMNPLPPEPHDDEAEADRERRVYRRKRRKARDAAGEIRELNITAMMDMMTILLVFMIKSWSASSSTIQMTDNLQIPNSTTLQDPQDSINVVVSMADVSVNDKHVAPVINGDVPAAYRDNQDASSMLLTSLFEALEKEVDKQKYIAKYNPAAPFTGRVNVVADRRVPYRTLLAVLYTAGQAELGQYKLMALKQE